MGENDLLVGNCPVDCLTALEFSTTRSRKFRGSDIIAVITMLSKFLGIVNHTRSSNGWDIVQDGVLITRRSAS